jgi:hypothetical protein
MQPNNRVHIVDLTAGTCTCRRYQAHGVPCGHAMSVIFYQKLALKPFLPSALSSETLRCQYTSPLPPVLIQNLVAAETDRCLPPMTRVPRGRPKKERIRKENSRGKRGLNRDDVRPLADIVEVDGELLVRPSRCKNCGGFRHNSRTCKQPHI